MTLSTLVLTYSPLLTRSTRAKGCGTLGRRPCSVGEQFPAVSPPVPVIWVPARVRQGRRRGRPAQVRRLERIVFGLALILGAFGGRDHAGSSLARVLATVIATAGTASVHRARTASPSASRRRGERGPRVAGWRSGPANRSPSLAIRSSSVTEPGGQPARKRLARAHRSSGTIHPASHGGVAQPGRAPPSHGGSQGFKSPHLHPTRDDQRKRWSSSCPALMRQSA